MRAAVVEEVQMRAGVEEDTIMDLDTCCMLDYKSFQCRPHTMSREMTYTV